MTQPIFMQLRYLNAMVDAIAEEREFSTIELAQEGEFAALAERIFNLQAILQEKNRRQKSVEEQYQVLERDLLKLSVTLHRKSMDVSIMLQNLSQGLFTIMRNGRIHQQYSVYLEQVFETKTIADRDFSDLLFSQARCLPDELAQVQAAVQAMLGEDELMFECNAHALLKEITCYFDHDRKKQLELDWKPIVVGGLIDKIMVTVRDVTSRKALSSSADARELELDIIGQILTVDRDSFRIFLNSARSFFEKNRHLITSGRLEELENRNHFFLRLHTVKGNARTYGFTHIANAIHALETRWEKLRSSTEKMKDFSELLLDFDQVELLFRRYEQVATEKLGRSIFRKTEDFYSIMTSRKVQWLLDEYANLPVTGMPEKIQTYLVQAHGLAMFLDTKSLNHILSGVLNNLDTLAVQLKKPVPEVILPDVPIRVCTEVADALEQAFVHLFSNALDHGIECVEARQNKGKALRGCIRLLAQEENQSLVLSFSDDGQGLAMDQIKLKAIEKGLITVSESDPRVIAQLIFSSGFTSLDVVSQVSGRGVGLDAVKHLLEQHGVRVVLSLTSHFDETKKYYPFVIYLYLPKETYFLLNLI